MTDTPTEPNNGKRPRKSASVAEQIEQKLLNEISESVTRLAGNGTGQELAINDPVTEARLAVVRAGMAEMQAVYMDRDGWRKRAEEAELRITELMNMAEQAKEGERLRLKEVSDQAITEARASLAAQEVLQGEIDNMRARLVASDTKIQEAQAEAAKYRTFALMVRASVDKLIPKD